MTAVPILNGDGLLWGGLSVQVDRDYMPAPREDVELRLPEGHERVFLSPDEARELAAALNHHADEVDDINKENDVA